MPPEELSTPIAHGESLKARIFSALKDINMRKKLINSVRVARDKAKQASSYWSSRNEIKGFAECQRLVNIAGELLKEDEAIKAALKRQNITKFIQCYSIR